MAIEIVTVLGVTPPRASAGGSTISPVTSLDGRHSAPLLDRHVAGTPTSVQDESFQPLHMFPVGVDHEEDDEEMRGYIGTGTPGAEGESATKRRVTMKDMHASSLSLKSAHHQDNMRAKLVDQSIARQALASQQKRDEAEVKLKTTENRVKKQQAYSAWKVENPQGNLQEFNDFFRELDND
jgi:hypothetical protein